MPDWAVDGSTGLGCRQATLSLHWEAGWETYLVLYSSSLLVDDTAYKSHFCGKLSTLYFLNGVWPAESVQKAFHAGPLSGSAFSLFLLNHFDDGSYSPSSGVGPTELKPFLVVVPHSPNTASKSDSLFSRRASIQRSITPPASPSKTPSPLPPSPIKNSPRRRSHPPTQQVPSSFPKTHAALSFS